MYMMWTLVIYTGIETFDMKHSHGTRENGWT